MINPSWAPHGQVGYYLGPAYDHYRCHRVLMSDAWSTRITDTVEWFPVDYVMPGAAPADILLAALQELTHAIDGLSAIPHATVVQAGLTPEVFNDLAAAVRHCAHTFHPVVAGSPPSGGAIVPSGSLPVVQPIPIIPAVELDAPVRVPVEVEAMVAGVRSSAVPQASTDLPIMPIDPVPTPIPDVANPVA